MERDNIVSVKITELMKIRSNGWLAKCEMFTNPYNLVQPQTNGIIEQ